MEKPLVVIVPGFWHTQHHYDSFSQTLNDAGFPVQVLTLPSVDASEPRSASMSNDADLIRREYLLPALEQGKDVVLLLHSYGGACGSAAARGLSKRERGASGLPGGILGLIYLSGFIVSENIEGMGHGCLGPWCDIEEDGQFTVTNPGRSPAALLYNRNPDEETVGRAIELLKPHSAFVLSSPIPPQAWQEESYQNRLAYIMTHEDNTIPYAVQRNMINESRRHWRKLELQRSDHASWMSKPGEVLAFVEETTQLWST